MRFLAASLLALTFAMTPLGAQTKPSHPAKVKKNRIKVKKQKHKTQKQAHVK